MPRPSPYNVNRRGFMVAPRKYGFFRRKHTRHDGQAGFRPLGHHTPVTTEGPTTPALHDRRLPVIMGDRSSPVFLEVHRMSSPDPSQPPAPTPQELKAALKAFKKRLKLTCLDDQSRIGVGPMSSGRPRASWPSPRPTSIRRPFGKNWPGRANSRAPATASTSCRSTLTHIT